MVLDVKKGGVILKLIKDVEVYSPEYSGKKDLLIGGGKILLIKDKIEFNDEDIEVIDGQNKKMLPGFIDPHVHITGGGGEGSFKTRVPEIPLSDLTSAGITTVVGLLGTDGVTRSVENVLAKAKSLEENGITALIHTGSYRYPSKTITDSVQKDVVLIDEIIGAKVAISDHRSSQIGAEELKFIGSEVRTAGMLADKAGIVCVHMGDGKKGLGPIIEAVEDSELPIQTFAPTHINRNESLLAEGFEFLKKGGIIDLTCGIFDDLSPASVISKARKKNLPTENITVSSDGYGSWSSYDEKGNLLEIGASSVGTLYEEFKSLVSQYDFELEEALPYFTSNPAKILKLFPQKGNIEQGADADLIIADFDLKIDTVLAKGEIMVKNGEIIKRGAYEN